ncbi:MAG: hypothetical protein ACD_37C00626G0002 [uncultured bacterium]|nr:MAG: hypothetical protein ACD_37C00626G0002 [uncultured bacterium]
MLIQSFNNILIVPILMLVIIIGSAVQILLVIAEAL